MNATIRSDWKQRTPQRSLQFYSQRAVGTMVDGDMKPLKVVKSW